MEFAQHKPIYLQIEDSLCDRIIRGDWKSGERIPSVRELAVTFGVNPNTVMRTYEHLESEGIIYNRRGIGYFLSQDAVTRVRASMKQTFLTEELPVLFRKMDLLGLTPEELTELHRQYLGEQK